MYKPYVSLYLKRILNCLNLYIVIMILRYCYNYTKLNSIPETSTCVVLHNIINISLTLSVHNSEETK